MFGLGPTEMIIIAIICVLLFGSRLPKLMYNLGNGLIQFKRGISDEEAKAREDEERAEREAEETRQKHLDALELARTKAETARLAELEKAKEEATKSKKPSRSRRKPVNA